MKYKAKIKIVKAPYWDEYYYKLVVKFYGLPSFPTRFENEISSKAILLDSLTSINNGKEYLVENEIFIDKCISLLSDEKEELLEIIKSKLIKKLAEISEQSSYDNKMNEVKKIDKLIKEINKNLIIEIIE